ncbi:MAG: glutamate racemase [Deltaproteobacteria bacterium]|nr:glutamate racemase [Deltaproteobacteria bacterium]
MTTRIGLFDSGVGGLGVWRAINAAIPEATTIYVADQVHFPYGACKNTQVQSYASAISRFLLAKGAEIIVVACNSASTAALQYLRDNFKNVPFVGMEPAVKPAIEQTRSKAVAVLATELTAQGEALAKLCQRFEHSARIIAQPCPGLAEIVEAGAVDIASTDGHLRELLKPLIAAKVDQLVLGCTHYSFLRTAIAKIVGDKVNIIDPAEAVARQVQRVLLSLNTINDKLGISVQHEFYTTAVPEKFSSLVDSLLPSLPHETSSIKGLIWRDESLSLVESL